MQTVGKVAIGLGLVGAIVSTFVQRGILPWQYMLIVFLPFVTCLGILLRNDLRQASEDEKWKKKQNKDIPS